MTESTHDVIVLGGGHNGLACAAALGRAGKRVLVLEQRGVVGGLAASEEFHPGYRTHGVLHDSSGVSAKVIEQLELARFGLRRREAATPVFAPQENGPGLLLHADPATARAELSARSEVLADRYTAFRAFVDSVRAFVTRIQNEPPPDLRASTLKAARPLLARGWALRRLGRRTMTEVLRLAPMSVADWLRESFDDPLLQAALAGPSLAGTWLGPRSAGSAALLLARECTRGGDIEGGPPALVDALLQCCRTHNVAVRTGAVVRRIDVAGADGVRGVELEGGEMLLASTVASSIDPVRTFLELLPPVATLHGDLAGEAQSWRCRGTTAKLHLALDGPPTWASRPGETFEAVHLAEDLSELERAFDAVKYGEMSSTPVLDVRIPTLSQPDLAPPGHHVLSALVHFIPHDLRAGWDDAARAQLLERSLDRLARCAPDIRDRIVGHELLTPVDLEQRHGLTGGHVHHGEHALDQLFWLRPMAACAQYATPIRGLYLCGSGSHPGGGITATPGALAAAAVLATRG